VRGWSQLFDFDAEVKPVLEVLVGKTLEQSLLEVLEEEELADLRQQQRCYEQLRNADMAEQQRLEEQDRRLVQEKVRDIGATSEITGTKRIPDFCNWLVFFRCALREAYRPPPDLLAEFKGRRKEEYGERKWVKQGTRVEQ